jgi:hypothetical protein
MQGYAYVRVFYPELYALLKEHGHLRKGLETNFKNTYVREMLIQEISAAYLNRLETLTDERSLFAELLRGWKTDSITEIISFFWTQRKAELKEETRTQILEFWRFCYERIRGHKDENAEVLADLNLLTVFLTRITSENENWLLQSAPYVEEYGHSQFFVEYLRRLVSENSKAVADVYLRMLSRTVPRFKEEDIRAIVEKLYQASLKREANDICNRYGEDAALNGYPDFLRNLYERYNQ